MFWSERAHGESVPGGNWVKMFSFNTSDFLSQVQEGKDSGFKDEGRFRVFHE